MGQNIKCPVPQSQRPLNEYSNLKQSFGFIWTTKDTLSFFKTSIFLILSFASISTVVVSSTPNWENNILSSILQVGMSSMIFFILLLLRVYLAWKYVYRRLIKSTLSYEESGWYDGQTWIKHPEILIQDRLAGIYEVLPILKKLELSLAISSAVLSISIVIYIIK